MNKLATYISALALCCSFAQCSDYLNTSSPENTGDEFVTSSTSETFKSCLGVMLIIGRIVLWELIVGMIPLAQTLKYIRK